MAIGYLAVDDYVWSVKRYLMGKYGCDAADRMVSPLAWYIRTGRASVTFLHKLTDTKPYVIGRILAKGGSDQEMIDRVRSRIDLPEMLTY